MRRIWAVMLVLWAGGAQAGGHGQHGASHPQAVGATVDELITLVKQLNPELAAAALEADAAAARAAGAGRLMDPKLLVEFKDIGRNAPSYTPRRIGDTIYSLRQELPFWGKRGLQREIAEADSQQAQRLRERVEADLIARVKVVYFLYHQAHLEGDQNRALLPVVGDVVQASQLRYAQGMASQQESISAELQRATLQSELVRIDADRRKARFRLNALLRRPAEAPLVEEPHPRPIPPAAKLQPALLAERAKERNPELRALRAALRGADKRVDLAGKQFWPDAEVGVGVMERNGVVDGYEAMAQINIPLQWDAKRADQREARANAAAQRERIAALEYQVEAAVHEACLELETARRQEKILQGTSLPQADTGLQAAVKGYEVGKADFNQVLDSVQRLRNTQVLQLRTQLAQQTSLAELEKLLGEDL